MDFLRTIRQSRWYGYPDLDWLPVGELQGDSLLDLRTTDNTLSVYAVNNEYDKERVTVALAANRKFIDVLDYAVFDDSDFASLGIIAEPYEGNTPDAAVNRLHYHLRNLTLGRLAGLAKVVSEVDHTRIARNVVKARISEAIAGGILPAEKLQSELLAALQ